MRAYTYLSLAVLLFMISFSSEARRVDEPKIIYWQLSFMGVHTDQTDFEIQGVGDGQFDYDLGYGLGMGLGYQLPANFRTEAEFAYRTNEVNEDGLDGSFTSLALMANGIFDIPTGTTITPYLGAGVGLAHMKYPNQDFDDEVLAFQGMGGLNHQISDDGSIYFGYKYFDTNDSKASAEGVTVKQSYSNHNFEAGYRHKF